MPRNNPNAPVTEGILAALRSPSTGVGVLLAAAAAVLVLVGTTTESWLWLGIAVGAAAYLLVLTVLGPERTAVVTLMGAFATAPIYKRLAPSIDSPITATDGLLVLGFALLAPMLITRRLVLPTIYLVSLVVVFITGCIGSLVSQDRIVSFISLALWLMVMGGLPIAFALWRPRSVVIKLLLWSYIAGHMVSTAYAIAGGPTAQGREVGLAIHFNYFAQAGLMSFALLLYLVMEHRDVLVRVVILGAAAASMYSIYISGSRAAIVVAAVLVLMVPVVERSAVTGFLWAALGAIALVALPLIIDIAGETSALGRLVGGGGSQYSDAARELGREHGLDRLRDHPFTGSGLIDLFEIHNVYLEVVVGIGIFGFLAYLAIMYVLARPLFSRHPHHRMAYVVWAYIGFGATIPSLYDRGIWAPVALTILLALRPEKAPDAADDPWLSGVGDGDRAPERDRGVRAHAGGGESRR